MHNILEQILQNKAQEVAELKRNLPKNSLAKKNYTGKFKKTLTHGTSGRIIAEIKRHSPSKGSLAEIPDATQLAQSYAQSGAAAISVLTDQKFFSGSLEDLRQVCQMLQGTNCAVLRKDFIIDTDQLIESAAAGADAVLLIASVLKDQLAFFIEKSYALGLDALVEVHHESECQHAIKSGAKIIGINHRDLHSFQMINDRGVTLLHEIPENIVTVAESGIHSEARAAELCLAGFNAVLIGEALVTAAQPDLFIHTVKKLCAPK